GGGTGTGSAPIIAQIAKDQGALTVVVATKPFNFEKSIRHSYAEEAVKKLRVTADTLIVIPNQKLLCNISAKTSALDAFRSSNDVLRQAVQGISECILETGLINIDFADALTVMRDQGDALMAIGYGEGDTRVEDAVSGVLDNPLLEDTSIKGANRALVYVAGNENFPLLEYDDIINRITKDMSPDAIVIPGLYIDPSLGDKIRVTVIASGFNPAEKARETEGEKPARGELISGDQFTSMMNNTQANKLKCLPRRNDSASLTEEELEEPTWIRNRKFINFPGNGGNSEASSAGQAQSN
ncbi:MAG: cell division protein FtsZ, partial [Treponema sp.]|nr:cell division protein FtsZ [Treponema sp.]